MSSGKKTDAKKATKHKGIKALDPKDLKELNKRVETLEAAEEMTEEDENTLAHSMAQKYYTQLKSGAYTPDDVATMLKAPPGALPKWERKGMVRALRKFLVGNQGPGYLDGLIAKVETSGGAFTAEDMYKQVMANPDTAVRWGSIQRPPIYRKPIRQMGNQFTLNRYGFDRSRATPAQLANRIMDGYSGHGGFFGNWLGSKLGLGDLGDKLENAVLDVAAPVVTGAAEDALGPVGGALAGGLLKRYKGSGSYFDQVLPESAQQREIESDLRWQGRGEYEDAALQDAMQRAQEQSAEADRALGSGRMAGFKRGRGEPFMDNNMNGIPDVLEGALFPDRARYANTNQLINPGTKYGRFTSPILATATDETGDLFYAFDEYLFDIVPTTSNFETVFFKSINPGLKDSIPLLSQIARNFAEYRFERIICKYRPLVSPGQESVRGSVDMCTLYNPNASAYTSKRQMVTGSHSMGGAVAEPIWTGIELDSNKTAQGRFLFTRTMPMKGSLADYDQCKFQVTVQGCEPGLTIGSLFLDYVVRLSKLSPEGSIETLPVGSGASLHMRAALVSDARMWLEQNLFGDCTSAFPSSVQKWPLDTWSSDIDPRGNESPMWVTTQLPLIGGELSQQGDVVSALQNPSYGALYALGQAAEVADASLDNRMVMILSGPSGNYGRSIQFQFMAEASARYRFVLTARVEPYLNFDAYYSDGFLAYEYDQTNGTLEAVAPGIPQSLPGVFVPLLLSSNGATPYGAIKATIVQGDVEMAQPGTEATVALAPIQTFPYNGQPSTFSGPSTLAPPPVRLTTLVRAEVFFTANDSGLVNIQISAVVGSAPFGPNRPAFSEFAWEFVRYA